jgi:hypothetical protein
MIDISMFLLGLKEAESGMTTMEESLVKEDRLYQSFSHLKSSFLTFLKLYQRAGVLGGNNDTSI